MKGRRILVSMVASLALVGVAAPAHAAVELPVGNVIGAGAAGMGILCNALNVLGLPLCVH